MFSRAGSTCRFVCTWRPLTRTPCSGMTWSTCQASPVIRSISLAFLYNTAILLKSAQRGSRCITAAYLLVLIAFTTPALSFFHRRQSSFALPGFSACHLRVDSRFDSSYFSGLVSFHLRLSLFRHVLHLPSQKRRSVSTPQRLQSFSTPHYKRPRPCFQPARAPCDYISPMRNLLPRFAVTS